VAKFKVVTPAGANYGAPGGDYRFELEALELLTTNGIAFISYNTLPGWRMLSIVRDRRASAAFEPDALVACGPPPPGRPAS